MNAIRKSLLTMITLFRGPGKTLMLNSVTTSYCDKKRPQDFYCDAEKPFISNF
ncbi:MAG: hypothetical protein AAF717_06420 [Bacteroidota bacterium]